MATARRSRGMDKGLSDASAAAASSSPLLAVLLVTSSSRGASLAFRYPRKPKLFRRYSKVRYYGRRMAAEDGRRAGAGIGGEEDLVGEDDEEAQEEEEDELSEDEEEDEDEEDGDVDEDDEEDEEDLAIEESEDGLDEEEDRSDDGVRVRVRKRRNSSAGEERRLSGSNMGGPSLVKRALERSRDVNVGLGNGAGVGGSGSDLDDALSGGSAAGGKDRDRETTTDQAQRKARAQKAYQKFLGYDVDFLASVLAPRRELCHQKFELVIDDLAFVGHPVCVDEDGRWDPDAEDIEEDARRGRDPKKKPTPATDGIPEGDEDASSGYIIHDPYEDPRESAKSSGFSSSTSSSMTLFHLVLVLDKPDPSPYMPRLDLTSWLQFFYDNIAFKMTAALFAEETRCHYISRESEKLSLLRERCMDDGQSYTSFLTHSLHVSSLARCLKQVHLSISTSSNAFVTINDSIDAHLQLPPLLHDPSRIAKVADVETQVDLNDPIFIEAANNGRTDAQQRPSNLGDVMLQEWTRTTGPLLLPWQTLLLLNDRLGKAATHTRGRPPTTGSTAIPMAATASSTADAETAGEESDEESLASFAGDQSLDAWARKFTRLLRPTLSGVPTFAEIAHLLDWDLYEDVYPMVRHLIYYREARVVDVPRIQNTYSISPLLELEKLPKLSISWSLRFANAKTLPPLVSFLANLSSGLRPFHHLMPARKAEEKGLCLDCLVWLLRHEVIVQMHVRLRLVASEEVKRKAAAARAVKRKRRSEIKEKRRQRDEQREKKRAARAAKVAARATAAKNVAPLLVKAEERQNQRDQQEQQEQHASRSAPADVPGDVLGLDVKPKGRGRSRERSLSPFVEKPPPSGITTVMNASMLESSPSSSSTGPSNGAIVSPSAANGSAIAPAATNNYTRGHSRNNSSAHTAITAAIVADVDAQIAGDELKFERRPVLRSRSPSRVLNLAGTSLGSSSAAPARGSSSRPSTPRGRAVNILHHHYHGHSRTPSSSSSGGAAPVGAVSISGGPTAGGGLPQSVPLSTHPSTTTPTTGGATLKRGNPRRIMSRSPSRARLRVTGFGEEEQIEVEEGGEDDEAAMGVPEGGMIVGIQDEDARRLSLVGEEDSGALGLETGQEEDSEESSAEEENEEEEKEEEEEDDGEGSEAEWWEWDPKASIIGEPSRATREENEWIAIMVQDRDAQLAQRFFRLLPYLNGKHTVDEIVYREEMRRRDLRSVLSAFKDEIMTFVHP